MPLTLVLGGARSGKSSLAVRVGQDYDGPVTFIATATPIDADMSRRIERHRTERPVGWTTVEAESDLVAALTSADDGLVIIDCLTLWTSNMMNDGHDDAHIRERAALAATIAAERRGPVVAVSNEVGLGIHPESELGRKYRDLLGWVNQEWARAATTSLLMVAGKALRLENPLDYL